jgi:transglutaminase-like putative cysteine protease
MIETVMAVALCTQSLGAEPIGASRVFTSDDPLILRVRKLMAEGKLSDAETLLRSDQAIRIRDEAQEIIRRLRREYGLDQQALVNKLMKSIPDIVAGDIERWRKEGFLQWRLIDGQVCYFRREPTNVLRFCEEAKRRRLGCGPNQPEAGARQAGARRALLEHLADVREAAEGSGEKRVVPIQHRVRYKLTVLPNRPGVKKDSLIRCWLPFPQEYRQQCNVKLIRTVPASHVVAPNAVDGRLMSGARQRSVYLEQRVSHPAKPIVFSEEFEYVSYAYYPQLQVAKAERLSDERRGAYLSERPPHIVFTPEFRTTVQRVVGAETNLLSRAQKIFRFVCDSVRYCAEEEYSVIPSLSAKALRTRRGDCGVQSMLFIAMCRAAGIPARWQSGWVTRAEAWDMHDWAEIYIKPWGWLPVDVSYGLQESTEPKIREFYFGHLDSYRLIVNLDYGWPLHPPKNYLRSEPADFQRGEVEIGERNLYFDEWEWEIQFEHQPLGTENAAKNIR